MNRIAACILLACLPLAAQDPSGSDRVVIAQRGETIGEITEYAPDGALVMRIGGTTRRWALDDVARLSFEERPVVTPVPGDRIRFQHGGHITGKLESWEKDRATVVAPHGTYTIARMDIKSVLLGPITGAMPELKENKQDVVVLLPSKERPSEMRVVYGRVFSVTADHVRVEDKDYPRAEVRAIHVEPEQPRPEPPQGLFARILLKNGDRVAGMLRKVEKNRMLFFSHILGAVPLDKAAIHSMTFVPNARLSSGNVILTDQTGIKEYDREGKLLWSYNKNVAYAWAARRIENGNILVANTNMNQLVEIRPSGKADGEVVWQMQGVTFPYDVQRLENGNLLVAEYYGNRVVEYDRARREIWSTQKINHPVCCERLADGSTFICSNQGVFVINAKGVETWRNPNPMNPLRATRLENGNTLVVEQQQNRVIEIDAKGNVVWKKTDLGRPVQAIRMEDGNTMILEQRNSQIVEVDPTGKVLRTISGLDYPIGMSIS